MKRLLMVGAILASIWAPTKKQALALSCPVYELMYGGAKGGGKSDFILVDFLPQLEVADKRYRELGVKSKGRALLVRKEFGRLKDLLNRAHWLFPQIDPGVRWREQDHTFTFTCGYRFEFGHLEGPQDHQNYQGQEFTWLGFDQVEEIPEDQYRYLKLQVRTSEECLKPMLRVRSTANPMGRHADWVKERFVIPCREGFKILSETVETSQGKVIRERVFIPATLRDNPHLPPEYEAELLTAPEHYRRAFLDGDWDVTPGSFFGDVFDPRIHVCDPFELPKNWEVFRAADWGSRAPACCLWIAIDNDSNLVIVEELYGPGQTGTIFGKKILEVEEAWGWIDSKGYSKLHGYMDHQGRQSYGAEGPTPTEAMIEMGISWFDADKERKLGWTEIRRRLMERSGPQGRTPGIRIFRNCRNLIRTLPNLIAKPEDMDDIDGKQEDHAADALRYGCMSRPMSRYGEDEGKREMDAWEMLLQARKIRADGDGARSPITGY